MHVLGINATFHDPAAALVSDGTARIQTVEAGNDPHGALECFGSAPVDLLAIGPFVVRRREVHAR